MSQRLIQPGMSAAEQFRVRNTPHIIGYTSRGPVWSVAGGAPEDGDPPDPADGGGDDDADDDEGDTDDDSDEDDTEDDDDDDKDKKDKKGKGKKDDEDDEVVSKFKYDKTLARMKAADKRSSDLQKQLEDERSKKDVSEEVKAENVKVKADNEKLAADNHNLTIKLGFFTVNTIEWEDPETALRLVDLSDVDVDDEGKIDKRALRLALKDLAKAKPYLVKKKTTEPAAGGAAPRMNGGRKGKGTGSNKDALAARFPVLGRQG